MNIFQYYFYYLLSFFQFGKQQVPIVKPHIVVIISDDMGWNDVGFHGSNEIPTPNIDALAYNSVILNRHYVMPTCTPSRAAFLTGRHPIRMGLQGIPMNVAEPRGVPLREKLLPEYLQKLGYVTRLVGKWHLGYYTEQHTPTRRGFDSFAGYYGGVIRYFNHVVTKNKHTGIDFHKDNPHRIEPYQNGQYFTDFISDEAEDIIRRHDKQRPLYLQLAHLAGHSTEGIESLEVRNITEVNQNLAYIGDINRRKYAGVIAALDDSVGRIVKALKDTKMLENTVILFMSDNGSPTTIAPYTNHGSNYPFRGMKGSIFEGGIRVPSFVFHPLIKDRTRVSDEYIHITDWLPTFVKLAGGDPSTITDIDGMDQWTTITGQQKSKRDSMLINIDEVYGPESAIMGRYKLVRDYNMYSPSYDLRNIMLSMAGQALKKLNVTDFTLPNEDRILELRKKATVTCVHKVFYPKCINKRTCLFDIISDPCETTDIAGERPDIKVALSKFVDSYRSVLINQTNTYIDPAGYPEHFNGYWMPWMSHEYIPPRNRNKTAIWNDNVFCEGYPMDDPRNCL
ncbi:arylsulfatase B-like isoform X2 [Phymastichus coffea]|uniref:arylsulfatase B-like isoform X2 n=1 Tax=Phymastichus coffea TaxID=108790 RepID=UPI00273B1E9B|nr:arylsulfatase B-like isoform X2 [Phymastichus coffea]